MTLLSAVMFFVWNKIIVDMVPSGYWTQEKITSLAKTWDSKRKPTCKNEPKVKSATEENAKKTSAQTVETKTLQKFHLEQNITDHPTEEILTLQETDAEDTPDNHLLQTLMTKQSNYTDQTMEQKVKCMPVNQNSQPQQNQNSRRCITSPTLQHESEVHARRIQ
jgi:hypothetical protein